MPILITGGTGFLGLNLVRLLVGQGKRVRLLVRSEPGRLGLESDLIEIVRGDVTDPASVRSAIQGCSDIYHLAAWVQVSSWGWETARLVNVEGTRHVCQAALDLGVRRLVHVSSIATIATGSMDNPADEKTPWNLVAEKTPYYVTKRESEAVVSEFVDRGLDAVVTNPTYLVGPWDIKPTSGRIIIHMVTRHLRFYPNRGGINYVDVRNVADGCVRAMEAGRTGQRYILGGENLSFQAYLQRISRLARVPMPRLGLPYGLLYPFAAIGNALGRMFPHTFRDANTGVLNSAFLEHYVSSEKARTQLGYAVDPIDNAIADAIQWFLEHAYLTRHADRYRVGTAGRL